MQLFRPPSRGEVILEVRARLLRPVLAGAALLSAAYLALGWLAPSLQFRTPRFPWDGLGVLALCAVCGWLLRRGGARGISTAASIFLAGISQPFFYASQDYGVASPVNAAFLIGLLLCGLLIGGWFQGLWTLGYCGWMALAAAGELQGQWGVSRDPALVWGWAAFWWVTFIAAGWAVWLFARTLERAAQVARGQNTTLTHTLTTLASNPGLEDIEGEVLKALTGQLGVRWASLFLRNPRTDQIYLHTAYGDRKIWSPERLALNVPPPTPAADSPIWQELVRTRKPILVDDVANDPRLRHRAQIIADGIQSIFYVPLVLGEEVMGFFSLNSAGRRRYTPAEIELAQALAQQVTLAVQISRLAEQGKQTAVLEERNRMAREMHDTLAQGFTGIVVQLEAAEDTLRDAPDDAAKHLVRARALACESLAEARRSVWALRPQALEHKRLPDALCDSITALTAGAPLTLHLHIDDSLPALPAETEAELLRIGQEAVTNVLKHAQASNLTIRLNQQDGRLTLAVRDDGRGFDPAQTTGGLGLVGMHERAARIGGELRAENKPGNGSEVSVLVNLEHVANR
jgi:signal transduction histidine kinase